MKNRTFVHVGMALITCCLGSYTGIIAMEHFLPSYADVLSDSYAKEVGLTPAKPQDLAVGQVVLIKLRQNNWVFAVVTNIHDNTLDVVLTDSKVEKKDNYVSGIKKLGRLWRWLYQPASAKGKLKQKIQWYLGEFKNIPAKYYCQGFLASINTKIYVIGDIHGDFDSLRRNFKNLYEKKIVNNLGVIAKDTYIVFTGDIANYGSNGIECWHFIMRLAHENPKKVLVLRGDHETEELAKKSLFPKNSMTSFFNEFSEIFGDDKSLWQSFTALWAKLPTVLLVGIRTAQVNFYDFIMLCHAGIDISWQPLHLMQRIIMQGSLVESLPSYVNPNQFLYGDYITSTLKKPQDIFMAPRAADVEDYTLEDVQRFMHACRAKNLCLSAIIRGHRHMPGGACRLIDCAEKAYWMPLISNKQYSISESYDVFTLMSCPTSLQGVAGDVDAYVELQTTTYGRWFLTPFTTKYKA